ncbi:MAG: DegV family protein [Anaerolineae bacterium]|nr:DegV family protein [Anaerolineae bacterium]
MTVKLIVDSTSDLPSEWLAQWDIPVLTAFVNFGEESIPDDRIALPPAAFYKRLAASKTLPGTAAPSPGLAKTLIERQLAKADHVIVFTVSSKLSSMYNVARVAAEEVDPKRVTVVDSQQVSVGLGWMVAAAAEAAEQGASPDAIIAAAMDTRERVEVLFVIDTLEYLRRGGRVNSVVASIGTLLQIKPILTIKDGLVVVLQRARTMRKAEEILVEMAHQQAPLERLAVGHTNFPAGADGLLAKLTDIAPPPPNTITIEVTTALGTHAGPGLIGFVSVRKK